MTNMSAVGFFVDWDGNIRRVEATGDGYTCNVVDRGTYIGVDVIDHEGFVCHQTTYFDSLDAVKAVVVTVNLI